MDNRTVIDAVASHTLFIHGSRTGGGAFQFSADSQEVAGEGVVAAAAADGGRFLDFDQQCKQPCGTTNPELGVVGTSTVCDHSCQSGRAGARFHGLLCGAGDAETYGTHCRLCYVDLAEARRAEEALRFDSRTEVKEHVARLKGVVVIQQRQQHHTEHVIMCDTLRPPQSADCSTKCARKVDTVSTVRFYV